MIVIPGALVWQMHATHGFPLELSLPALADQDQVPSWAELLRAAQADGVNMPRLVQRIIGILPDAYDAAAQAHIVKWLPVLLESLNGEG